VDNREAVSGTITSMFTDVLHIALSECADEGVRADLSGCVHVWGSYDLVLTLEVNDSLAQRAAMALLETDAPLDSADVPEAFAELINIIAGNLTGMLEDAHFTRPVIARGATILVPNARRTMRGVFQDEAGGFLTYEVFPGVSFRDE
jgi:chemotaxis phosphatase CheX-like protein